MISGTFGVRENFRKRFKSEESIFELIDIHIHFDTFNICP